MYVVLDRLPSEIRAALAAAPYNYSAVEIEAAYAKMSRAGVDRAEAIKMILDRVAFASKSQVATEAYALYGGTHPQAVPCSDDVLAAHGLLKLKNENEDWRRRPRGHVERSRR